MSEPIVVYSNVASVEVSPFDILITFGTKKDRAVKDLRPEDVECLVYMSPQHAKAITALLTKSVEEFERRNGVLSVPGLAITTDRKGA